MTDDERENDERWVKTTFLRRIAHDIVGSAGVAKGALDEIERGAESDTPQQQSFYAIARRSITKLERIARRLRYAALAEAGELPAARAAVDLRGVVDKAEEEASSLDGRRTVKVERIRGPEPLLVNADAEQLFVAIAELLSNAIRFARTRVRVREQRTERGVTLTIDDDGPGFPITLIEQLRPRLRSRDGQRGLGASLPVAVDIIEQHGGTLELSAAEWEGVKRGARVVLTLPR
jgi:signal transduction histidine kinase